MQVASRLIIKISLSLEALNTYVLLVYHNYIVTGTRDNTPDTHTHTHNTTGLHNLTGGTSLECTHPTIHIGRYKGQMQPCPLSTHTHTYIPGL